MRQTSCRSWWLLLALLVLAPVPPAGATLVVPVRDEDLVAQSTAIVVGRVQAIQSQQEPASGEVTTDITVDLDDVLKGDLPATQVTIRQPGGRVGRVAAWVEGSPAFHRGERVLLFLTQDRGGVLRVAHLFQGKFSLHRDAAAGQELAIRDERPPGVEVLGLQAGAGPRLRVHERRAFESALRALIRRSRAAGPAVPRVAPPAVAGAVTEAHGAFTFLGEPARWFEPDAGQPVAVRLHSAGLPGAPTGGFGQVRAALAAWTGVPGSSFAYRDAGLTGAAGFVSDGVNAVSFGDPRGQIDPPSACRGTLAIGGFFRTSERRTVGGRSFYRIVEGDVVFADGWAGCGIVEDYARLAQVATHELGHVLGLGHSDDPDATMAGVARFDGRGAALRADDRAGLLALYPAPGGGPGPGPAPAPVSLGVVRAGTGSGAVSSSPAGISCGGDCSETYPAGTAVTLSAAPAAGSTFAGWSGGGCSGAGPCRPDLRGNTTVTATFNAAAAPAPPPPPPPAPPAGDTLRLAMTAPTAGATVRGTAWAVLWLEGSTSASNTYTLSVGGLEVGRTTTPSRGPVSVPWDTTRVPNGPRTLVARVRDGAGRTGTAQAAVTVANAGSPPPAPAPPPAPPAPPAPAPPPPPPAGGTVTAIFTSPAAGATVGGDVAVNVWVEGQRGAANTFTLVVDDRVVAARTTAGAHVTFVWPTRGHTNGPHTLTAIVTDAAGRSGRSSRTVTVRN